MLKLGLRNVVGSRPPAIAPPIPTDVVITVVSDTAFSIAYVSAFPVEFWYSTDNVTFTKHGDSASTPYPMTGLTAGTKYWVKARAKNGSKFSEFSTAVSATTQIPFESDLLAKYETLSGYNILDSIGEKNAKLLPPCGNFNTTNYLKGTSLLTADEVIIRFKTTSTARMGIIGVSGFGTIILRSNEIIAGVASVTGNSALATYNDGAWHIARIVKTGTVNVFQIYFDGDLLSASSDGNWRNSTLTYIGCAYDGSVSLGFDGQIDYIKLVTNSVVTNEWQFCEGEFSQKVYDCVGVINLEWADPVLQNYSYSSTATDYAKATGASIVKTDTENVILYPYLNGAARTLETGFTLIRNNIDGIIPKVAYFIDFNPTSSADAFYDFFDSSDTDIYENYARVDLQSSNYIFRCSDIDLLILESFYKAGSKYKLYPKCIPSSMGESYYITGIYLYGTAKTLAEQNRIINFTGDVLNKISQDTVINYSITPKLTNVVTSIKGGLTTRLYPDAAIAEIFEDNGYKASFVIRTPADYKSDETNKVLFKSLQDAGHDVGFWFDVQMTLIKLYDNDWENVFSALDADYIGEYDAYNSPLWGIQEVFTVSGQKYLGLNSQIRYKVDDAIIQPVDGTGKIKITNIPESALLYTFLVLLPDNALIPESLRNKWVFCGTPSSQTPADREFPILLYEQFTMNEYGAGNFSNPTNATLVTSVGLDMTKVGENYTAYNRTPANTNGVNERGRYLTYHHAILAFEELGLERPYIVGEPRNIVNEDCLSTDPLKDLNFISGTVDPLTNGHTVNMFDLYRWRWSTKSSASFASPITAAGTDNSINFNTDVTQYTAAEAFTRILDNFGRNRWIMERQASEYNEGTYTLWDDLLQLCAANNVPVKSLKEIGQQLFDSSYPATINVFPLINSDKNADGTPDGYQAVVDGTTYEDYSEANGNIESGYAYFSRTESGVMANTPFIGGLLHGKNDFYLYAFGKVGDIIRLTMTKRIYDPATGQRIDNSILLTSNYTVDFTITEADTWQKLYPNKPMFNIRAGFFVNLSFNLVKSVNAGEARLGQIFIKK